MKSHNENNHVHVSEKQNATSVIIIHIKTDSFKSQKILDPAICVVSGVCGEVNEVSEKRSATSVIVIHIKSDSLKNQKKILHPAIFVVTGVYGKENQDP